MVECRQTLDKRTQQKLLSSLGLHVEADLTELHEFCHDRFALFGT